jgi:hypothetical protein
MSDVAFHRWLPGDAVALDRVREAASTDTTRQRSETCRAAGQLQKQLRAAKLMTAVLDALPAADRRPSLASIN